MTSVAPPHMRLTKTVAFKLFVLTAVTQTALLAALAFAVFRVHETHLTQTVEESATRLSDLIARSTRHSMMRNQKDDVQTVVTAVGSQSGIKGIRIYSKRGRIVFSTVDAERQSFDFGPVRRQRFFETLTNSSREPNARASWR